VLAAGGSSRLGRPKQLLPYGPATLLDSVLATARACRFDQLVVALGGGADEISDAVDLRGVEVVINDRPRAAGRPRQRSPGGLPLRRRPRPPICVRSLGL
jgi:CTP:molybdopterin cytidylyltransferase MocA